MLSQVWMTNSVLLNGLLFMLSLVGLMLFFNRICFIKPELVPVFVISLIICVLNAAGLLGALKPAADIIYLSGFLAYPVVLVFSLVFRKSKHNQGWLFTNPSFILLVLFSVALVFLLKDMHLSHYDNFSHWALAVKEMLSLNTMPNTASAALMDFTGYPLGSSLFIYYGCSMVGGGEGMMLILQGIFMVSCMLPLLVFNKKLAVTIIPVAIIIYFVFMIEPKVFNLLVDTLLACLGFASLLIILYYRKNITSAFFVSLPTIIALVLVKNSGIFFAAIDVLVLGYFALKAKKANFIFPVLTVLFVGTAVWTWNLHCQVVFLDVVGKHSITSSNFESILAGKSVSDITTIARLLLLKLVSKDAFIQTMLALNVIALCVRWWNKLAETDERKVTKVMLWLDLTFVLYTIGIFAMYVFSMPLNEALYLAGYERYMVTIVLYLVLVFSAYLVYISSSGLPPSKKSNRYAWILLYFLVLIAGYKLTGNQYNILDIRQEYKAANPTNAVMAENVETPKTSYAMYVPEEYRDQYVTGYFNYLMKYKLLMANGYPFVLSDLEQPDEAGMIKLVRDYDYLIIYDEDEYIKGFAKDHLDNSEDVIGIYAVSDYPDLEY